MESLDQNTIIALVIVAGAILFALFYSPSKKVALVPNVVTPAVPPGRALIDAFEESGKNGAGIIIETRLGEQKASEIMASLGSAFGGSSSPTPAAQAAPVSASSSVK